MINLPSLVQVKQQLISTTKRFPLPTLGAAIMTFLGIYLVHDSYSTHTPDWVWQSLVTAMLGLVALSALTLVAETTTHFNRGLIMLGGTLLLGLYFWVLPADKNSEGTMWLTRHIFLILGSLVTLSWVPFWKRNASNKTLWLWCSQLIGSIVITAFFGVVLFLGLAAALWSVERLFDLEIDGKFYFDIWIIVAGLFCPLFFLSQFELKPEQLKEPKTVSPFMGIFTKYIMSPLSLGYLVILYAYTAKILITWEWPKNVLGWLVIAFLGVAIFTYFLWTPLLKDIWDKYRRIFWLVLIPQIGLLFIAIGWRIRAYNWTENRYFVVVLGLWLLGTTVYFLSRKNAQFKWVFIALTALIFVSQVGPLSGYNIAKKSQETWLMNLLIEINVKQGDSFVATQIETNDETENQITSILDYLVNTFGEDVLNPLFPTLDLETPPRYPLPKNLMKQLGLEYRDRWQRNETNFTQDEYQNFNINQEQPLAISGFDWQLKLNRYPNELEPINGYTFKLSDVNTPPKVEIYRDNQLVDQIEVTTKLETLFTANNSHSKPVSQYTPEESVVRYESELLVAKVYLNNGWKRGPDEIGFDADILLRFK